MFLSTVTVALSLNSSFQFRNCFSLSHCLFSYPYTLLTKFLTHSWMYGSPFTYWSHCLKNTFDLSLNYLQMGLPNFGVLSRLCVVSKLTDLFHYQWKMRGVNKIYKIWVSSERSHLHSFHLLIIYMFFRTLFLVNFYVFCNPCLFSFMEHVAPVLPYLNCLLWCTLVRKKRLKHDFTFEVCLVML